MGCRLVRGETIYFVRHGGRTNADQHAQWYSGDDTDSRLLPNVFTRSEGHNPSSSVVPIEIRTFEA